MKKVMLLVVASLLVLCAGNALAVPVIDGTVSPVTEWDIYKIFGTDPNEAAIADNYDLKAAYAWWDSTNVYLRADVYGVPTLAKQDSGNFTPAFYQWGIDTTGDNVADLNLILELANQDGSGNDRVALYRISTNTLLGYGPAKLGSIVEASFAESLVPFDLSPASDNDVAMFLRMDNAGSDPDDRLPNEGFQHTVPEPASAALIGLGLLGFVGALRRKFMA